MALFEKKEAGVEDKEEEKEEEKKSKTWQVGEITTQTTPVIVNTKTGEQLDLYLTLASIKNDLEYIKSFLG